MLSYPSPNVYDCLRSAVTLALRSGLSLRYSNPLTDASDTIIYNITILIYLHRSLLFIALRLLLLFFGDNRLLVRNLHRTVRGAPENNRNRTLSRLQTAATYPFTYSSTLRHICRAVEYISSPISHLPPANHKTIQTHIEREHATAPLLHVPPDTDKAPCTLPESALERDDDKLEIFRCSGPDAVKQGHRKYN